MQQGYVAVLRKPYSAEKGKVTAPLVVGIITVLPKGKHNPKGGPKGDTELALMEEILEGVLAEGFICESVETIPTIYV